MTSRNHWYIEVDKMIPSSLKSYMCTYAWVFLGSTPFLMHNFFQKKFWKWGLKPRSGGEFLEASSGSEFWRRVLEANFGRWGFGGQLRRRVREGSSGGEFGRQVREASSGGEFGRRVWEVSSGGEFGRRFLQASLVGKFGKQVLKASSGCEFWKWVSVARKWVLEASSRIKF
jgi:hypothetical protein